MRVLICGGRSDLELRYGARIAELMQRPATNLVGKDTLIEFLATLARATAVLTPDSGPVHMATTVGTPVLGLYAATTRLAAVRTTAATGASTGSTQRRAPSSVGRPRSCPGPPRSSGQA
jgi:ADP-heptose:LPS heptosyltransferase